MKSGMQNSVMSEKNVQLMCYLALSGEREEVDIMLWSGWTACTIHYGKFKAWVKLFLNIPEDFEATSNRIICQDHDPDIKSSKKEVSLDSVESLAKELTTVHVT